MSDKYKDFVPAPLPDQKTFVRWWIEDLRSGEFKQTHGYLADGKGHCCLGVAQETLAKHGIIPEAFPDNWAHPKLLNIREPEKNQGASCGVFVEIMGHQNPSIIDSTDFGLRSCIGLNDTGSTFKEIADMLEKKYLS